MRLIDKIKEKSKGLQKKIIFPEATDERILKAVIEATKNNIIKGVLVGKEKEIKNKASALDLNLEGIEIIEPLISKNFKRYVSAYAKKTGTPEKTAELIVQQPLFFSALAVLLKDVDGMVAGAIHTSGDVIAVCKNIIGLQKNIVVPSSFFLMSIPNYEGGENGTLMYADASVNPNPTPEELADIAIMSAQSAKKLLGWKPRVAMLSFSTKGSAEHHDVCKVIKATEIARKKAKKMKLNFEIDGELQADSALVLETARKKIAGNIGKVAGRANILIFPDLDAGNIAYKLTQILAKANAYGPILQGFNRPVSDLSRGANVEDIIGVISIVAVWADNWEEK
ncbi:MAG: phosphate acyltransferase [Candidatus Pacearchaeota archaeon]